MSTYVDAETRADARSGSHVPAYGPIDAVLGYVLFYVVVDRATPTVVAVLTDAISGLSPSVVGLGLAAFLWFVLAVTVVDQVRRQLAALGVLTHETITPRLRYRPVPSSAQTLVYLVVLVVGAILAALTAERAIETAVSLIPIVATLDVAAFVPAEFVVMVVFFVSFSAATHSLDRLVIGGIRALRGD